MRLPQFIVAIHLLPAEAIVLLTAETIRSLDVSEKHQLSAQSVGPIHEREAN